MARFSWQRSGCLLVLPPFVLFYGSFAAGGDVLCAVTLEDFFRAFRFVGILRMHRDENVAFPDFGFVALGFVFRDAHAYQSSDKPARRGAYRCATQRGHYGPRGNEWSQPRYREGADAGQPAQSAAEHASRACSSSRAFGRLGALFVREIL